MTTQNEQPDNGEFTFFCPECHSSRKMRKSDIGKEIECEDCCETVKIDYPETRPCPKCKKSIKLNAKVCKHCKQHVMPFVDPFAAAEPTEPAPKAETSPAARQNGIDHLPAIGIGLIGLAGGFAVGFFGTRALARLTHRCISGHADYIVASILAIYLAIRFYRAKK